MIELTIKTFMFFVCSHLVALRIWQAMNPDFIKVKVKKCYFSNQIIHKVVDSSGNIYHTNLHFDITSIYSTGRMQSETFIYLFDERKTEWILENSNKSKLDKK